MRTTVQEVLSGHQFTYSRDFAKYMCADKSGHGCKEGWFINQYISEDDKKRMHNIHLEQMLSQAGLYDNQDEHEELIEMLANVRVALNTMQDLVAHLDQLCGTKQVLDDPKWLGSLTIQKVAYKNAIALLKDALT